MKGHSLIAGIEWVCVQGIAQEPTLIAYKVKS